MMNIETKQSDIVYHGPCSMNAIYPTCCGLIGVLGFQRIIIFRNSTHGMVAQAQLYLSLKRVVPPTLFPLSARIFTEIST